MDLKALCHEEVKRALTTPHEFIEEVLGETVTFKQEPIAQWAAATGLLTGLFKAPSLNREGQLKQLYDHVEGHKHDCQEKRPGPTFARCIILSEQGLQKLSAHGIDIAKVRATMKEIHQPLFSIYMEFRGNSTRQQCLRGLQT